MTPIVINALAMSAMFLAIAWGAYINHRWMQRFAQRSLDVKLVSTTTMIQRLQGLLGTSDLTAWEQDFVRKLAAEANAGRATDLTGAQVEKLDELHGRHFA